MHSVVRARRGELFCPRDPTLWFLATQTAHQLSKTGRAFLRSRGSRWGHVVRRACGCCSGTRRDKKEKERKKERKKMQSCYEGEDGLNSVASQRALPETFLRKGMNTLRPRMRAGRWQYTSTSVRCCPPGRDGVRLGAGTHIGNVL